MPSCYHINVSISNNNQAWILFINKTIGICTYCLWFSWVKSFRFHPWNVLFEMYLSKSLLNVLSNYKDNLMQTNKILYVFVFIGSTFYGEPSKYRKKKQFLSSSSIRLLDILLLSSHSITYTSVTPPIFYSHLWLDM